LDEKIGDMFKKKKKEAATNENTEEFNEGNGEDADRHEFDFCLV